MRRRVETLMESRHGVCGLDGVSEGPRDDQCETREEFMLMGSVCGVQSKYHMRGNHGGNSGGTREKTGAWINQGQR